MGCTFLTVVTVLSLILVISFISLQALFRSNYFKHHFSLLCPNQIATSIHVILVPCLDFTTRIFPVLAPKVTQIFYITQHRPFIMPNISTTHIDIIYCSFLLFIQSYFFYMYANLRMISSTISFREQKQTSII